MACLQAGPDKKLEKVPLRHWDPCLHPDEVIYNAVSALKCCLSFKQMILTKGVFAPPNSDLYETCHLLLVGPVQYVLYL